MEPTREKTMPTWSLFSFWANGEKTDARTGVDKNAGHNSEDAEEIDANDYQSCDYWAEENPIENSHVQSPPSLSSSASSSSFLWTKSLGSGLSRREQKAATICACFLKDYEKGQPPTLSSNFSGITRRQLLLYRVKHSYHWKVFGLLLATVLLFVHFFRGRVLTLFLQTYAIVIFAIDLWMMDQFFDYKKHNTTKGDTSMPGRLLFHSMKGFLCLMSLQTITNFFFPNNSTAHALSLGVSVFKPIVFFYQSRRARDAMEALIRISIKLLRVILIEMFLILTFAAVASRLYYDYESFQSLPQAWLSLFTLSTTVVNPSIWMPMYYQSPWNAIFFVIFIVVSIFYLHSLVLSVVFQVFIQSVTEVHRQSARDKDNSLKLAFLALTSVRRDNSKNKNNNEELLADENALVDVRLICEAFRLLRPHYNQQKLDVLTNIIVPSNFENGSEVQRMEGNQNDDGKDINKHNIDFGEFRKRIPHALSSSVRVTRTHSAIGMAVEFLSISVAIVNFLYVIIFASRVRPHETNIKAEFVGGSIITLLTLCETWLRYNPWQFSIGINPITRINTVLDGMGCLGGIVSFIGMIMHLVGNRNGLEYLLIGRAIGMIQSMRFSIWFREVLQRSLYVLPFLAGPIFLILTTMHIFVYVGMALWEGAVDVEEQASNENVEYLYYLNNFNSYSEGCITVFNVLVVNDWHQIAKVFLYADRCSSPLFVYLYFVLLVIVAVCILLNVIVAFFVETFVTQLSLVDVDNEPVPNATSVLASANTSTFHTDMSNHIAPIARSWIFDSSDLKKTSVRSLSCPDTGEKTEFDVIRKEGFDDIIQSVANDDDKQFEHFARGVLDALELVQTLTPDRNTNVGHVLCGLQKEIQFHSNNFPQLVKDYLTLDEDIQCMINEMKDIFLSTNSSERVGRCLHNPRDGSKVLQIHGALLPQNNELLILTAVVNESMK